MRRLSIRLPGMSVPQAVTALVKHGADLNARDHYGDTPLHMASRIAGLLGADEVVDVLLRSIEVRGG